MRSFFIFNLFIKLIIEEGGEKHISQVHQIEHREEKEEEMMMMIMEIEGLLFLYDIFYF